MPNFDHSNQLRELISSRLQQFKQIKQQDKSLTRAAVVLGVAKHSDGACLLLTRRSSKLRKHAGQYALPGGKLDPNETLQEAALRELSEELNLAPGKSNVMGELDDITTQSGFCITPVVVWIENHKDLRPNPDEVAAVYEIPLHELESVDLGISDETDGTAIKPRTEKGIDAEVSNSNLSALEHSDTVMSIYLPSVGHSIYSPTAAIMYQFKEVAMHGRATRVAHFGQPKFAWK